MTKHSSDLVANETSEKSCPFVLEKLDGEIDLSNSNIPLVDLKANYRSMKAEIDASIADVLASCYFVGGPQCKEFEKSFSDYCGVKHCIGVNSGTDALFLALKHVGVKEGDDVIIPANTFVATALAVSAVGANVVLVDCLADTMMMDTSKLEAVCTPKTKAVIPVHLYGCCVDMEPVLEFAQAHNLFVVEDAAQAHGAMYNGQRAGSMGDVGCFSFYPGKNLGAFGDGGAVVTNNTEVAEAIRFWQNWGASKKYHHVAKGGNSRLDTIQAAVLSVKLRHLDECNTARGILASLYTKLLDGVGDIVLPSCPRNVDHVWHLYIIRTEHRDRLLAFLNARGIGAGIHYPIPLPCLEAYSDELGKYKESFQEECPENNVISPKGSKNSGDVSIALSCANRILSLPIFPEMTNSQVHRIVDDIKEFFTTALA